MTDPQTPPAPAAHAPELDSVKRTKQLLRQASLVRRGSLSDEHRAESDRARSRRLWQLLTPTGRVAMYLSRPPEPDTLALAKVLTEAGRPVLAPLLTGRAADPTWALLSAMAQLRTGPLGIPEPNGAPLAADALTHADTIVVSGLAGTADGARLGVGGGWFDRALSHARPDADIVLLLHDAEVCTDLPLERHDRRVRHIVTENRTITCW
ncbi:5-formyltetrahydrofolate cyclo-ligase [Aestuariimicrobium sp. T2.26MG-19.2B]|uniref:5-formyltetrahydrofolate cyclo-ligase n=1 Tax=Aestuariimicrobium sp. T2.26MG-19.2B TaxID=3040679 RepID=UPI002477BEA1|nr:5-formyltetrahydrofolate cyclo-ligase [Aestuariimicrobium sp. T2.26MG-19.2B]CAI9400893.1 5-formyltetrahydrofolate cyclo-ligase [Aestuariimicrobium sp. T2.26MG-19.2B]